MASAPILTRNDRRERHLKIARVFRTTSLSSRQIAAHFGMNDSHVRSIARLYGVSRKPGRPVQ